jgi:uncharacterized membrane protein YfcA
MRATPHVQGILGGVAAGLAGGLFGVGGGIVLVPLLTARYGLTQHQAHGTSLAVIGITAAAGLVVYGVFDQVAWRTAAVVAVTSMIFAGYGARLAARTPSVGLARAFAVLLVLVAVRLLYEVPQVGEVTPPSGMASLAFDLALGVGVGLLSGYMGVGGGVLAVPAFTLVLGMSQQAAQGTALAVILVTGPAGTFQHAKHGNVVMGVVPALAAGAVVGAPLSSWVAQLLSHEILVRSFAIFLIANAAYTWIRATARASGTAATLSHPGTTG